MKYIKKEKYYEYGDKRIIKKFLIFPMKKVRIEHGEKTTKIFWLGTYYILQRYAGSWKNIDVDDNKENFKL